MSGLKVGTVVQDNSSTLAWKFDFTNVVTLDGNERLLSW